VCDLVLQKESKNPKAYLRKGMALVSSGDLSQARQVLEAGQVLDDRYSIRLYSRKIRVCVCNYIYSHTYM